MKKMVLALGLLLSACSQSGNSPAPSENTPQDVKPEIVYKHFAYAGAQYTNLIHQFSLDPDSGKVTPLATASVAAQNLPMITAGSYDAKFLLAINYSSHSVSSYTIAKDTGELSLVEHKALGGNASPGWVVGHPSKSIFYTADSGLSQISILDIDSTGHVNIRGQVPAGSGVTCLFLNKAGTRLYSVDQNVNQIGIYDVATDGALTAVGTAALPAGSSPNQAVLSPDEKFIYVANWGTQSVAGFAVQGASLVSLGASVSAGTGGVYMVSVSPDGQRLFANKPYGNNYSEHAIDLVTGAIGPAQSTTMNGSVNFSFWKNFAFSIKWSSAAAGIPIETHAYSASQGLTVAPSQSTAEGYRGIYQLTIVSVPQD